MKALTIKQPWAQLIVEGVKDIENRTWKTNFRGRIYVHSSAVDPGEIYKYLNQEQRDLMLSKWDIIPKLNKSSIIGEVDIIDCVVNHKSIWAQHGMTYEVATTEDEKYPFKPIYNWVLANPVKYDQPILNIKGALSFWQPNLSLLTA